MNFIRKRGVISRRSGAYPRICEKGAVPPVPFLLLLLSLFVLPPSPCRLEVRPPKPARGSLRSAVSFPSGVRGRASAENKFGALQKATGGNNFVYSEYHVLQ